MITTRSVHEPGRILALNGGSSSIRFALFRAGATLERCAHGKIERRLDKFILTDHSANGTFVTIDGDKEIVLRREEFTLRGHGWIAFGQSRSGATDVIEFFCE